MATVQTVGGDFGFMRRPVRLNNTTAVAFDENSADAAIGSTGNAETAIKLSVHIVNSVGGAPTVKTLTVPNGDGFWESDWVRKDIGTVMNDHQVMFAVHGPPGVMVLNNGAAPFFGSAGGAVDDWARVTLVKVNNTTAGYVVAKEGQIGLLRITPQGGLEDHRLTAVGQACDCSGADETGVHQPASQPVAISPAKFVVAQGGGNGAFVEQGTVGLQLGGDDGMFVVNNLNTTPTLQFVTVGNLCGAPGCKPLAMGTAAAPVVVFAGPGANGEFEANDDQSDNDDELLVVKGL